MALPRSAGTALHAPRPPTLADLRQRREELVAIARRHGASNLRVFGSVARGTQRAGSDIDLLVDLDPDRSLLDLGGLLMDLQDALGCAVDIGEGAAVRQPWRQDVEAEAVPL